MARNNFFFVAEVELETLFTAEALWDCQADQLDELSFAVRPIFF